MSPSVPWIECNRLIVIDQCLIEVTFGPQRVSPVHEDGRGLCPIDFHRHQLVGEFHCAVVIALIVCQAHSPVHVGIIVRESRGTRTAILRSNGCQTICFLEIAQLFVAFPFAEINV